LLATVGCNAIFARRELLSLYHEREPSPADVFLYEGHKLYELNWHEARHLGLPSAATWVVKKAYQKIAFWRSDWEKNQ
jgi:hypothetical protein